MSAESELTELLGRFNRQTATPLSNAESEELAEVSVAAAELGPGLPLLSGLTQRVADGMTSWASVWADPIVEGQAGLDLLGAVMQRAARDGGGRPLE